MSTIALPPDELNRPPAPPAPTLAPPELQAFLILEAELLDSRRLEEWLSLYTSDCMYWVPAEPGQTDPDARISLCYDDRSILEDRIWRLHHPKMFSQNPAARQVRLVSNFTMGAPRPDDMLEVHSKFVMVEHRGTLTRFFGGRYEHVLRATDEGLRIARKTVRLPNCDAPLANIGVPL